MARVQMLDDHLQAVAREVDRTLAALMDQRAAAAGTEGRKRLVAAMRHASVAGGKRIRPFLAMETAALFGPVSEAAKTAGIAVELVHCYSLVHDDLPSMDNDLMRRGQPTVHIAFDEATAILAGDALLTLAFEILTDPDAVPDPALAITLARILAKTAGEAGMVGGQMLDLDAEGRFGGTQNRGAKFLALDGIADVQSLKTGAIIRGAVLMGAHCGGLAASDDAYGALVLYADHLGRAFQIADDLIDATGDAKTAGKAVAKDAGAGKATFVSALGLAGAQHRLAEEIGAGEAAISVFGARADMLAALIRSMATRKT